MEAYPTSTSPVNPLGDDFLYGWDLLYRSVEQRISKKADVLMVFIHFLLTKHCNLRCVGIGDDRSLPNDDTGSELLSDQWNDDRAKYSLRYMPNKMLYLLLANVTEDALIVNLLDVHTKNASNLCLTPEMLVADVKGSIARTMPAAAAIVERIRRELSDPILAANSQGTLQHPVTHLFGLTPDPLLIDGPGRPVGNVAHGFEAHPHNFPDVGRGDLNPLGVGMGNLFSFPRNPGPIRPNVPGQGAPNPDQLPPPDWNPDYY